MRLAFALLLLGGTALAKPPPSGTYVLDRKQQSVVVQHFAKKRTRIPDCKVAESIPIPVKLRIEYKSGAATITVNGEAWDDAGPNADGDGHPRPGRHARNPKPPSHVDITVFFNREPPHTVGSMMVLELDANDRPVCAIAYGFEGVYVP